MLKKILCLIGVACFCFCSNVFAKEPITLSLDEAILLGVRTNPNVESIKLSYVLQKFNLYVANWQFYPHYSLQAAGTVTRTGTPGQPISTSHNYTLTPAVSLLTPIGTSLTLTSTNTKTGHFNPQLQLAITQPLMQGFGRAIVETSLNNARDSEVIARMNIEGTLRQTVTNIINAYLDVISAKQTIKNDEAALDRAKKSVQQTKLYIKAGRKAGNELVTVKANVASAQSTLENDKNALLQSQYALLTAIGVDPNSNIRFVSLKLDDLLRKYHFPPQTQTVNLALENDISYQASIITLNGVTTRAVMTAEDNARWQLNFTLNASTGGGSGGGQSAGFDSLFNGANQTQSANLTLNVPIDNQTLKQAVLSAKVSLKQAKLALEQDKWQKETTAINSWNSVKSAERAKRFAEEAEMLQEKTYQVSYQKYLHGLIDSLELQTAQVQLIQAQQTMLSAQITYLKALVNLDYLVGNTLKTWDVKVRLQ